MGGAGGCTFHAEDCGKLLTNGAQFEILRNMRVQMLESTQEKHRLEKDKQELRLGGTKVFCCIPYATGILACCRSANLDDRERPIVVAL